MRKFLNFVGWLLTSLVVSTAVSGLAVLTAFQLDMSYQFIFTMIGYLTTGWFIGWVVDHTWPRIKKLARRAAMVRAR